MAPVPPLPTPPLTIRLNSEAFSTLLLHRFTLAPRIRTSPLLHASSQCYRIRLKQHGGAATTLIATTVPITVVRSCFLTHVAGFSISRVRRGGRRKLGLKNPWRLGDAGDRISSHGGYLKHGIEEGRREGGGRTVGIASNAGAGSGFNFFFWR